MILGGIIVHNWIIACCCRHLRQALLALLLRLLRPQLQMPSAGSSPRQALLALLLALLRPQMQKTYGARKTRRLSKLDGTDDSGTGTRLLLLP